MVTLLALSLVVGCWWTTHRRDREIIAHLEMGKSLPGGDGSGDEIGMAVIAYDLHAGGGVPADRVHERRSGRFFVQFGWTAQLAVLFSLVVARLLTPMFSAYFRSRACTSHTRWINTI